MKTEFEITGKLYVVDLSRPIDISIPLQFNGDQPNTYDVPRASSKPYRDGTFIGDTRLGGKCNFEAYRLIPHCNGTHTECVGHIAVERISLHNILKDAFIPSSLISVTPEPAVDVDDTTDPDAAVGDRLITEKHIRNALHTEENDFLKGLIIRTLPNDESKTQRRYAAARPPYFSKEAMEYIVRLGVEHLLVDIPSVDRAFDEGKLTAHHIFWQVQAGSHKVDPERCSTKTITEMVYLPDTIKDGRYLVNLQVPAFVADAAPSRPLLYVPKLK